ncbi:LysR family transcriptional regulator [Deefgea rivuli]|uniref:LysR family transcriptional regulator n=1 Tax=Deefgea rivuli TaxID=400948 RepID=UPI000483C3C9|nr:LysR family transcriptional regulator [Deefgea rivuli]
MSATRIPSLKLLTGFEAAARLGSFARAADELFLSQSAISHQINELETQIGQPLFHRVGRGVELTVAGEVLQRSVRLSIETLRNGLGSIATYLDPGLVSIVCPAPVLHGWLQPRLNLLLEHIPSLCPVLSTDESARFIDELDVDIAIFERPLQQPGLLEVPLLQDQWLTVARTDVANQLAQYPKAQHHLHTALICLEENLSNINTARFFREDLQHFRKRGIYDDPRLLLDAALRGQGIACISYLTAQEDIENGRLQVLPEYPTLSGNIWWISRTAETPRAKIVTEIFDWLLSQSSRNQLDSA